MILKTDNNDSNLTESRTDCCRQL